MLPANLLSEARISCGNTAASKKRILEEMGRLLATSSAQLTREMIFEKLLERERLGSTGLGQGIALPHARISGIDEAYGAFMQLKDKADFDALDSQPVDLAFGLMVPEEATQEHLQLLAKLAALFSDPAFCSALREARTATEIMQHFQGPEAHR